MVKDKFRDIFKIKCLIRIMHFTINKQRPEKIQDSNSG
jgi:hypothetical protein